MSHAFIRGFLAGGAALIIEIFLAATLSISSGEILPGETDSSATLPLAIIAAVEEILKYFALRGFPLRGSAGRIRRTIGGGIFVGIGFAAFESCVKVLFIQNTDPFLGILSAGILHISTGAILGVAWLFSEKHRGYGFGLLFLALFLHFLYNNSLAPFLASIWGN